jgi:hypothetical protein
MGQSLMEDFEAVGNFFSDLFTGKKTGEQAAAEVLESVGIPLEAPAPAAAGPVLAPASGPAKVVNIASARAASCATKTDPAPPPETKE